MTVFLHPLPPRLRAALGALAFIGTALYAISFILHPEAGRLVPIATGIGLSAGLAWMILGKVILYTSGRNGPRIMMWFDTCLLTMAAGEVVLLAAGATNVVASLAGLTVLPWVHLALLVLSDVVMGAAFITRAALLDIAPASAATLWIAVLNGSFAILMVLFGFIFGYA